MRVNERRPAGAPSETGSRSGTSIPPLSVNGWCHADPAGNLDLRCLRTVLDAETRAFLRGYASGRESVWAEIDASAAEVVGNAARSIDVMAARRRPYVIPDWATPTPEVRS